MEARVKTRDELPEKLLAVRPPIKQLWYRGEWPVLSKCVAVVGSRRMSRYGKQALVEIIPRLVESGYAIVSGLMYGVDQEAHRLTLENGGVAIGILGYGITYKSEEGANKLAEQIVASGGVIMSEYPGAAVCQRWMFPQRNRIVVGLSEMVMIIEAGEKSGTLSTAQWAQKMGKTVYAVPGSVFSQTSEGANYLVAEGLAKALTRSELDNLTHGIQREVRPGEAVNLAGRDGELVTYLRVTGPLGVNELSRGVQMDVGETLSCLLRLEMRGIVGEERGIWKTV